MLLASAAAGRRGHLAASVLVFVVGAIVCATAPNIAQLVAGRTVQGLGAGAILSQSRIEHDIAWVLSFCCPTEGAELTSSQLGRLGYRGRCRAPHRRCHRAAHDVALDLLRRLPPSAVGLGLSLAFPPTAVTTARPDRRPTLVSRLGILVLFAASATSFLIGLSWGGIDFAWPSAQTLVPLLLGFIGLVGTAIWTAFAGTKLVSGFSSVLNYVCAAVQGLVVSHSSFCSPIIFTNVLRCSFSATCTSSPSSSAPSRATRLSRPALSCSSPSRPSCRAMQPRRRSCPASAAPTALFCGPAGSSSPSRAA